MYEDCVLEGILDVLIVQRSEPVLGVQVTLEKITWHEVDSCALAYRMAAQQAMQQVLGAGGFEFIS
jgi:translation elongation factor EF-G